MCAGPVTGPHAEIASYYVSVPWSTDRITGTDAVLRYERPPPCADIEYAPISGNASADTVGVYAFVLMARAPCSTPRQPASTSRA